MEEHTGTRWNWSPFSPRKQFLGPTQTRMYWQCVRLPPSPLPPFSVLARLTESSSVKRIFGQRCPHHKWVFSRSFLKIPLFNLLVYHYAAKFEKRKVFWPPQPNGSQILIRPQAIPNILIRWADQHHRQRPVDQRLLCLGQEIGHPHPHPNFQRLFQIIHKQMYRAISTITTGCGLFLESTAGRKHLSWARSPAITQVMDSWDKSERLIVIFTVSGDFGSRSGNLVTVTLSR